MVIVGLGLTTNFGFATIADDLSDSFISTGFALVLVLAGLSMLRNPKFSEHTRMPVPVLIVISLVIGSITGFFGIGGGFLAIPVLVLFFGTPQAIAAGTSLLIIALNSFISFLGHHALWDSVEWHIPIFIGGAAIVVAQVASHYSAKTTPDTLRKAFAYLLLAISVFTIAQSWL